VGGEGGEMRGGGGEDEGEDDDMRVSRLSVLLLRRVWWEG